MSSSPKVTPGGGMAGEAALGVTVLAKAGE
jgi:hypothetical protein